MISVCLHPILVIVIVIAIVILVIVIFTTGSQPFHRLKIDVQQLETTVSYEAFPL
jgi:hypothetical protein